MAGLVALVYAVATLVAPLALAQQADTVAAPAPSCAELPVAKQAPAAAIACLSLGRGALLSLGAAARLRSEAYHARDEAPLDQAYLLQRYQLTVDLQLGTVVRLYVEPIAAFESWRNPGPRPFDADALDAHQAFVDITAGNRARRHVTLRAGRQELALGASRYVGVREPANVRLTFDGVRAFYDDPQARATVTAFALAPTVVRPGVLDDSADLSQRFWGVYGSHRATPALVVDWHYFGQTRDKAVYQRGSGAELRQAFGGRLSGQAGALDFDVEATVQSGQFAGRPIFAYGAATYDGYTLRSLPLRPRLTLRVGLASGDGGGRALGTLDAFYPRFAYPTDDGTVGGPANSFDVHPGLELHAGDFTLAGDWDVLWRVSARDGIYAPTIVLSRSGATSRALGLGSQAALLLDWRPSRHVVGSISYAHAFVGPFLRATGTRSDIDFGAVTLSYEP